MEMAVLLLLLHLNNDILRYGIVVRVIKIIWFYRLCPLFERRQTDRAACLLYEFLDLLELDVELRVVVLRRSRDQVSGGILGREIVGR
jgi:hypothetical protein